MKSQKLNLCQRQKWFTLVQKYVQSLHNKKTIKSMKADITFS